MKNIVIDTSVAIKWFFPESGFKKALELKDKHIKKEISICSCDLFLLEFTSAFKNYSPQRIEQNDFSLAVTALVSLKLKFYPLRFEELKEMFNLSRKLGVSVYDVSFVILSKKLKATFYTADKKLYLKCKDQSDAVLV